MTACMRGALRGLALYLISMAPAAMAGAQSLAARVASADGKVQLTYAARADACGNGADMIRLGQFMTVGGLVHVGRHERAMRTWASTRHAHRNTRCRQCDSSARR